jgi:hypothetical protein
MMLRKLGAIAIAVSLATAGVVLQASARAVLVLKNGERLEGELVDMGAATFTMRVSGDERQVPIGEAMLIDFTGSGQLSPRDTPRMMDGMHLLVYRDGRTVAGTLVDVGGVSPLTLAFAVGGERQSISSADVGRIYLARPPRPTRPTRPPSGGGPSEPTVTEGAPPAGALAISSRTRWTSTGIFVNAGDQVRFEATGTIQLSADPQDLAGPAGKDRRAPNAPMPAVMAGGLLGRIGDGAPFAIGNQTQYLTMPAAGTLALGVNDDELSDNRGQFNVKIERRPRAR